MSAIDRAHLAANLWPGIMFHFGMAYREYGQQWTELYDRRSSTKAYEIMQAEHGFGLAAMKDPGAAVLFDTAGNVWQARIEHQAYGLGYIITREAVEDDQYFDLVPKYTRALKRSMLVTREIRGAAVYDRATNGSYLGGDGKSLGANDHPLKNGDTWSNLGVAADLNETSLEAAHIDIGDWTDERGLPIAVRPIKLVIPNGLQFVAERLLGTDKRPGTADNDINAMKKMGALPGGYAVNNYLTNRRQWYLKTDVPDGMLAFDRTPLDVQNGDGMDNQVMKTIAYERYSHGWADPRGLWVQPG